MKYFGDHVIVRMYLRTYVRASVSQYLENQKSSTITITASLIWTCTLLLIDSSHNKLSAYHIAGLSLELIEVGTLPQ